MDQTYKSRTQKKNEDKALEKIGRQLMALSSEQLAQLNLSEELYDAVITAQNARKHGAKRRQAKYIRTLMRQIDDAPIQKALENLQSDDLQNVLIFKKIEKWRDELKAGRFEIIDSILDEYPDGDRQQLIKLARNAHNEYKESQGKKPSVKASRVLFRYLRELTAKA